MKDKQIKTTNTLPIQNQISVQELHTHAEHIQIVENEQQGRMGTQALKTECSNERFNENAVEKNNVEVVVVDDQLD